MEPPGYAACRFCLEIDGISLGGFVSCSGLGARTEVLRYAEGGAGEVHSFRGKTFHSTLVLERGIPRSSELHDWFVKGDRRDGAVVLLSAEGREVLRWNFSRGWPCRWEGPALDARTSGVALERLEIAHEGLEWVER